MDAAAISIIEMILQSAPTDVALIQQVISAVRRGDQTDLDAAHASALAAANAERPAGADPLT